MKTIQRHIAKEYLRNFLTALAVLAFLLLISKSASLFRKGLGPMALLQVLPYLMVYLLPFIMPIALLSAAVITFSRMAAENEVTALRNSGLLFWRETLIVYLIGILTGLTSFYIQQSITPLCAYQIHKAIRKRGVSIIKGQITAGQAVIPVGDYTLSIAEARDNDFVGIVIKRFEEKRLREEIQAQSALLNAERTDDDKLCMILRNGSITAVGNTQLPTLTFDEYHISLVPEGSMGSVGRREKDMSLGELQAIIDNPDVPVQKRRLAANFFHEKYAFAAACLLFVILGIPLGIVSRHGNRTLAFGLSLLVIFVFYYPIMLTCRAAIIKGQVPALVGAWIANVLLLIASAIIMRKAHN